MLSAIGRIGSVIGSQVLKMNSAERPWVSGTVFGVTTLLAACLIFTLPETRNLPLTQTLDEAEVRLRQAVMKHTRKEERQNNIQTNLIT